MVRIFCNSQIGLSIAMVLVICAPGRLLSSDYETVVVESSEKNFHEASSVVTSDDFERRLPRSAPDALRYEPGVFVQQTAHGQGSAFIRGLTGQQTLIIFDGIRLNNSTYRQGPNQYFFTLDSQSIEQLTVLRGGGSTVYGSDALGGVLMAQPILAPPNREGFDTSAALKLRGASADREYGGRIETRTVAGPLGSFVGGVGGRRVGLLDASGPVRGVDGVTAEVPRFKENGRTQLGTGFDELSFDARLEKEIAPMGTWTAAIYGYRQYDAPRTDQCPPATARFDECLTYEEQFRTLAYVAWQSKDVPNLANIRTVLSFQRQHERRALDRPASFVRSLGRDDVDTWGLAVVGRSRNVSFSDDISLRIDFGADAYFDQIDSVAFIRFTDIDVTLPRSRGQYLDNSNYWTSGVFVDSRLKLGYFTLRSGLRQAWIRAHAPADPDSGTKKISEQWFSTVGHVGLEWHAIEPLRLLLHVDRSFRAPNLDDLTSRQQTGPGFQFENSLLQPEHATSLEVGFGLALAVVDIEFWAFETRLENAIGKKPMPAEQCPPNTPECLASRNRFQLVNANGAAAIRGIEALIQARLRWGVTARLTTTWTFGEGPNLSDPPSDPSLSYRERVPLSRIPPVNGTFELVWNHSTGLWLSGAARWAGSQTRLAVADRSDVRIPRGGTRGFFVLDARAGLHLSFVEIAVSVENILDAAYRYHGSSVNGPERSVVGALRFFFS